MNPKNDFQLRDVTLRDGLQLTGGMLSTERKASIVRTPHRPFTASAARLTVT